MNANDRFESALDAVMRLDLFPIKFKLMHVASGEGWNLEKANAVEKEYRRFLCLMSTYPDEIIAPMVDVDTFWHYHILDTMKYAADCQQAFGYFLHHYPYVGMRGEDDEQVRIDSGERMRTLYEAAFGEAMAFAMHDKPAMTDTTAAWCAGPAAKLTIDADGAMSAWCAGPAASGKRMGNLYEAAFGERYPQARAESLAYCASPHAKMASVQVRVVS
jgi:hypothetical protein